MQIYSTTVCTRRGLPPFDAPPQVTFDEPPLLSKTEDHAGPSLTVWRKLPPRSGVLQMMAAVMDKIEDHIESLRGSHIES